MILLDYYKLTMGIRYKYTPQFCFCINQTEAQFILSQTQWIKIIIVANISFGAVFVKKLEQFMVQPDWWWGVLDAAKWCAPWMRWVKIKSISLFLTQKITIWFALAGRNATIKIKWMPFRRLLFVDFECWVIIDIMNLCYYVFI